MCLLGLLVLFNLGIKCKSVYKGNIIHIKLCPALLEVIGSLSGTEMKLGRPESLFEDTVNDDIAKEHKDSETDPGLFVCSEVAVK